MNDRDRAILKLLLGQCCCHDEEPIRARAPTRPAVHGRPLALQPPQATEAPAFVAPPPSWDSPQRSAAFGTAHVPGVTDAGAFLGEARAAWPEVITLARYARDDGTLAGLTLGSRIDHQARELTARTSGGTTITPGYTPGGTPAPIPATPGEEVKFSDGFGTEIPDALWINIQAIPGRGLRSSSIVDLTAYWDGRPAAQRVAGSVSASGTIYRADLALEYAGAARVLADRLRIRTRWERLTGDLGRIIWIRIDELQAQDSTGIHGWTPVLFEVARDGRFEDQWPAGELPDDPGDVTYRDADFPLESQTWDPLPPIPEREPGVVFRSPDGAVVVQGPDLSNPADLTGRSLTAWETTLSGGSWAALRDTPTWDEEAQVWDFSPVLVLHEAGGTFTALRPGRAPETCTRAVFETQVLRAPVGSFLNFSPVGATFHSWPEAWAFARCADGSDHALVAHNPWRDSVKQVPESPELDGWSWPGRPRRPPPPDAVRDDAPRLPLGVTLADLLVATEDEPRAKGDAPWIRPAQVEIWDEDAATWVVSLDALAALDKRILYAPTEWPEELDDRTGVQGRLRLTFGVT
ncbi:hypothetical protein [Deinococcus radiotolerans]|uniref:Uncharacterized protein n=1 Tax=Deinococcus radiotolerans TaxID=1309407 RepID=A0ABQ2FR46_9DEIO|nr:hypothetical protein [Deinococcus radiotolerans]GGL18230.1 hypothetical protein GCM10010844_41370 [Deinococcus radiotolerans]